MKPRVATVVFMMLVVESVFLPARLCAQNAKTGDFSSEPFVVEKLVRKTTFKNDGTSTEISECQIRVQSQAAVQQFGLLKFPYASATSRMQIAYVKVVKGNQQVVETPAENVVDMPADITRQAPLYSDLRELQVAVKGLEVGDRLEFETLLQVSKPLDPGQFWSSYSFVRSGVVLQEELEIRLPRDRKVMVKSATIQPANTEDGAYNLYTWKTNNLRSKSSDTQGTDNHSQPTDVQVTTFQSWDELGDWFRNLIVPRAAPTPEIRAKADELTRGAKTQAEKIQDLYTYVATKFRYIGIDLGIGRYQPHAASDVLSNDYGDCKDKHTLLAALLAAEGVEAYPALVSSEEEIDVDVPSPAQFNHLITAIPEGKGYLFLDTTPEVGPLGFLVAALRDKKALVIPNHGPSQLVETPADPPFSSFFHFQADATLDGSGTLESKMQMTFRGDSELLYRLILRQASQAQWPEVMQKISQNLGFGGTVSDVSATPPGQTESPFHIEYNYKRKDYSDWSERWISPPFPPIFLPDVHGDTGKDTTPIKLGSPEETDYQSTIKLPAGLVPKLPDAIHLSFPFAQYDATYSVTGNVLHVEKRLVTKERQIAPGDIEAYGKFEKAIENDEKINIYLGAAPENPETSENLEAQKLYEQGRQALQLHDMPGAIDYFQRAVDKDPKLFWGWMALGILHAATGSRDEAISEFQRAISIDPQQTSPYESLSALLLMQHQPEGALAIWKELEKTSPANTIAPLRVGAILLSLKWYSEAVPELERAVQRNPRDAELLAQLGIAYARTGAKDKAIAAMEEALQADSSADILNTVAYAMAEEDLDPSKTLQYAQQAVKDEEDKTSKIEINNIQTEDLGTASHLAAYWDTLGWAYFHTGDLKNAGKYLNAGWHLSQDPVIADHLGELYEKEGKRREAIEAYESAMAAGRPPDHSTSRVEAMDHERIHKVSAESLQNMRIVDVRLFPKPSDHVSAEFYLLLGPGSNPAAKFVNGSEELRNAGKAVSAANFNAPFPDEGPVRVLRRGVLDCEPERKMCTFAMYPLIALYPAQPQRPYARLGTRTKILDLNPQNPSILNQGGNGKPQ